MICLDRTDCLIIGNNRGMSSYYIHDMYEIPRAFASQSLHKKKDRYKPMLPKEFLR